MKLRDKLLIVVFGILIFGNIGAITCTYYSTGVIDLILVVSLGLLVFVDVGVIACSYSTSRIAKLSSN
ncbi:MAG: hypothetical protein ACFFE3_11190 [Candidatus Thorarchaeota archaeon]